MNDANTSSRRPHYRLMSLSRRTGKAVRMASGSLSYLQLLGAKGLDRGRKWIELSTAPASLLTLKKPRRPRGHIPALPGLRSPPRHFHPYLQRIDDSVGLQVTHPWARRLRKAPP